MSLYAIIRIRGTADVPPDVKKTLELLRLHRRFHCTVYPKDLPGIDDMLMKISSWATWGEIDRDVLVELLRRRGRAVGNRRLTDEYVNEKLKLDKGIEELADKLINEELQLHKLKDFIKPVFRLHPPKGGFKGSIKRPYKLKGELGYRGSAINDLLKRMM